VFRTAEELKTRTGKPQLLTRHLILSVAGEFSFYQAYKARLPETEAALEKAVDKGSEFYKRKIEGAIQERIKRGGPITLRYLNGHISKNVLTELRWYVVETSNRLGAHLSGELASASEQSDQTRRAA
jgi:hypothetical protein